jgi:hypothetical protein
VTRDAALQAEIGEAAGVIWRHLEGQGALTLAALRRGAELRDPVFLMAVGWLAREGKVRLERAGQSLRIELTDR